MRRLAALVAALAMIGVSLVVRSAVLDDGSGHGGGGPVPRLVCTTELEAPCHDLARRARLDVTIEDAGTTAARLAKLPDSGAAELGLDGWIAPAPLVDIVRAARTRDGLAPLLDAPTTPFARSPLVLAVWKDRAAVLAEHCPGGVVDWHCIGDVAGTAWNGLGGGETWGAVKPGHANPTTSAVGVLVLGQLTARYFGRADLSSSDLDDDAFLAWLARLERAVPTFDPPTGSPFEQMLVAGPAAYDTVGTSEAEVAPLLARAAAARKADLSVLYPEPVATADLVLAPVTGHRAAASLRRVVPGSAGRAAFARAGWRVEGAPAAPGVPGSPRLPADDGLPPAGTLQALQATWQEATR